MSVHYHVFLGPYLEVHNPMKDTVVPRQTCPNEKCSNHKKKVEANFCPRCGEKIRHIGVPARARVEFNAYDEFEGESITEFTSEDIKDENYIYFHTNRNDCPGTTFYDSPEVRPIDGETPNKEMAEFSKYHAKEIGILEQKFGKDSVKVKWGVFAYWY